MAWIIAITLFIAFLVLKTLLSKRMKFWRLANKHQDIAFGFFMNNPETFAFERDDERIDKSVYCSGPFYFVFMGCKMTIYANPKTLVEKQQEFIAMF